MAFNSNGQISYLVLDSLSNGSKYGLEIIEFISQKTGGSYILKKPSLYSCLTRMEKKGLVSSSYWGESELGGKRHYYSITNQGRKNLEELSAEFANYDFKGENSELNNLETNQTNIASSTPLNESNEISSQTNKISNENDNTSPVFLQQGNIFDMVKQEQSNENKSVESPIEEGYVVENQMDFFNLPKLNEENLSEDNEEQQTFITETIQIDENNNTEFLEPEQISENQEAETFEEINQFMQTETKEQSTIDDGKFLDDNERTTLSKDEEEQNQRIYDTSSELKKYRKRKSFSENQIEMNVVYEKEEDIAMQKARIEELKKSMLNLRQNNENTYQQKTQNEQPSLENSISMLSENKEIMFEEEQIHTEEDIKDDAIFITGPRMEASEVPIQRKIAPTNIEVNIFDDNLPAPKRNANLEPTYKDMMAKLFERKKEKEVETNHIIQEEPIQSQNFADYDNLKKYYQSHGIEFKEYKKTSIERNHNTNFLQFISSTILLLLSGIGSAVLFGIICATGHLKIETNFMFYTFPVLFFVYCLFTFVRYKIYPSKKASLIYNGIINWSVFILASLIVLVINIACGMQFETISDYLTSLLMPIFALLIAFPINYHTKKILYKKFAK